MALPAIDISTSFIGSIKLTGNQFKQTEFTNYINGLYPDIIEKLLGNAVLNFLEQTDPLPEKYTDLLSGVEYSNIEEEKTLKTKGVLSTVYQLLYFEIIRDNFNPSHAGNVKGKAEVSDRLTNNENAAKVANEYNRGVRYFNQQIIPFLDNYKDFEQSIDSIIGSTVNTSETLYLLSGDVVEIGGEEFTVDTVTDGVSFTVTTGTPEGSSYKFNPFELVEYCEIDSCLAI